MSGFYSVPLQSLRLGWTKTELRVFTVYRNHEGWAGTIRSPILPHESIVQVL